MALFHTHITFSVIVASLIVSFFKKIPCPYIFETHYNKNTKQTFVKMQIAIKRSLEDIKV